MSRERRQPQVPSRRIRVVIMSYGRPQGCRRLLGDVLMARGPHEVSVCVYNDASIEDYAEVLDVLRRRGWEYVLAGSNHGKKQFWRWIGRMHADQRSAFADYWIVLPDDVRLCRDFFTRMITLWEGLTDPTKICLSPQNDLRESCWNKDPYVDVGDVTKVGWVDGPLFWCTRKFFEALDYGCPKPSRDRWDRNPRRSSGVGQLISTRLNEWNAGLGLYRTKRSHVVHTGCEHSKMNEAERLQNPLLAHHYIDDPLSSTAVSEALIEGHPVVACIATIPGRERELQRTVASLHDQVDKVVVYLNGWDLVPGFLQQPRLEVVRSQDHGDHGDASKFWWAAQSKESAYYLTCDDDIVYPADYARQMIEGVERYGRRAFVGVHGFVLPEAPKSYYRSRECLHWEREQPQDQAVHGLGTGLLAFHSDLVEAHGLSMESMRHRNMADVNLAVWAKTHEVPMVLLEHRGGIIEAIPTKGIYHAACENDPVQTLAISEVAPWTAPELPVLD